MTEQTQTTSTGEATEAPRMTAREAREERDVKALQAGVSPRLLGKPYFRRKRSCPFSEDNSPKIDYKDVRILSRYISPYGKMLPSHLTGVSATKQRKLAIAIKRARHLALMPYTSR